MRTHVDLLFADGKYRFALGLDQIHEVQTACGGAGIGSIYARVLQGRVREDVDKGHPLFAGYHADDLVETVRQGLIGGGKAWVNGQEIDVGPMRANELVERYLLRMPLSQQWDLAAAILFAKIEGFKDDEPEADVEATGAAPDEDPNKKKEQDGLTIPAP